MTAPHNVGGDGQHASSPEPPSVVAILVALGHGTSWLFVNLGERRLRAGWRILAQTLLLAVVARPTATAVQGGLQALRALLPQSGADVPAPLESLAAVAFTSVVSITFTVWLARRLLDRRSWVSLGLALDRRAAVEVVWGFVLAGVLQATTFASLWSTRCLRVTGFGWQTQPLSGLLAHALILAGLFALVAWYEELLWRGYWLQNAADGLHRAPAVLVSSVMFAVAHGANPNVTWVAIVGVVGAGLLLAWAWVRTGRLWLSIGLHLGWNWFEGPVFGLPVSGIESTSLIRSVVSGPTLWTGDDFGPEAGLAQLPALVLAALAIALATRARARRLPAVGN